MQWLRHFLNYEAPIRDEDGLAALAREVDRKLAHQSATIDKVTRRVGRIETHLSLDDIMDDLAGVRRGE